MGSTLAHEFSTPANLEGYGHLLRAMFIEREKGRWRYRYRVLKRDADWENLALRVYCERYSWRIQGWEEAHKWWDLYCHDTQGHLLFRSRRYVLARSLDPWSGSNHEKFEGTPAMMRQRRADKAMLDAMIDVKGPLRRPQMLWGES